MRWAPLLLLVACGAPKGNHLGTGGPLPSDAPVIIPAAGPVASTNLQPDFFYIVTGAVAPLGAAYHVQWRTQIAIDLHEFYGSLWSTAGFASVTADGCKTCIVTLPIALDGGQSRIDFDGFSSNGEVQAFDVVVDAEPLYLDLFIDGQRAPSRVFLAFDPVEAVPNYAPAMPFGLLTSP